MGDTFRQGGLLNSCERRSVAPRRIRRLLVTAAIASVAPLTACAGVGLAPVAPAASPTAPSSEEQLIEESRDQAWLAFSAKYPAVERPDVAVERRILADEWVDVMLGCLSDEGFPGLSVGSGGGIEWAGIPDSQMQAFDLARYVCTARFPRDPRQDEPLNEAQLDLLYDYYTGELTECLTARGFEVPPAPSRQHFRDSYYTTPWMPHWDAYASMPSAEAYAELEAACPQLPEGLWDL